MYFAALCLILNWTLRECGILIVTLPISLSRGLFPFLSLLNFFVTKKGRIIYIFSSRFSWCSVFLVIKMRQDSKKLGEFLGEWNRETETSSWTNQLSNLQPDTEVLPWRQHQGLSCILAAGPEKQQNQVGNPRTSCNDALSSPDQSVERNKLKGCTWRTDA